MSDRSKVQFGLKTLKQLYPQWTLGKGSHGYSEFTLAKESFSIQTFQQLSAAFFSE